MKYISLFYLIMVKNAEFINYLCKTNIKTIMKSNSESQEEQLRRYNELLELVNSTKKDFTKFYIKGNKSAGVRLRKHMQDIRSLAKTIRFEVQSINSNEEVIA